jgi:tRNA 2-selenouridine synthase
MPAPAALVPMVAYPEALAASPRAVVDLRSPGEFATDHLPGAVNVPLFDDVDRAVVGTLYHRLSPEDAFAEGRKRTRDRIAALASDVARHAGWTVPGVDLAERVERMTAGGMARLEQELVPGPGRAGEHSVLLYCWRGGLRSRSVVAFLRGLGLEDAVGLEGGYRAYRSWVRSRIEAWHAPASFVLRGLTGVGKTLVLREVARLEPDWVLDLEGLAAHRSSILGMVGLRPVTQKAFETALAARLEVGFPGPCVVEGESRKVGDIVLPPTVWAAIAGGVTIELTASLERRVEVLIADYLASVESRAELARQLPFLEERLGARWRGALVALLESGREAELVEILLERYYDPLYRHSEGGRTVAVSIDASEPAVAARAVVDWIRGHAGACMPARGRPAL